MVSEDEDFGQIKRAKGNMILDMVYFAAEAATHKDEAGRKS